jgi:predicted acyl esterase
MHTVSRIAACALMAALRAGTASAQQWTLKVPEPPPDAVRVTKDIRYTTVDGASLLMDVYRPAAGQAPLPAVIFYTLYWPAEGASARASADWFKHWARLAAANGIVAILPDLRAEPGTGNAERPVRAAGDDFQRLIAHLTGHAADPHQSSNRPSRFRGTG